jgi:benzaldehyde dehydrogenase (NAD)
MVTQPGGLLLPSDGGRISLARRVPHGVVGIISPFNFPLILSIRAVAPALAAGNTVVLKPDPQTPVTGGYLMARVFEEAGLPRDCLQVLPGGADVGQAMCADPSIAMISFTGSTSAGSGVGELAGKHLKKVTLELGGKNRLVILDDADVELAASCAAWGSYLHQGQICMTTGLILAHEKIVDKLTELMVAKATHLPVGDPASQQVALGPLISARQRDRVHGIVQDSVKQGAHLAAGGSYDRLFYKPTVLTGVKPGMRAFEEEVFGPVASIVSFSSEDEAVELANRTVARRHQFLGGPRHGTGQPHPDRPLAHQRPDRRRRAPRSLRRARRFGQWRAPRRAGQLGGVHPVAVGDDQGHGAALSFLSQRGVGDAGGCGRRDLRTQWPHRAHQAG